MSEITFESLLSKREKEVFETNIGRSTEKKIDRTGCFYHVITRSFDGGTIYYQDTADYRHSLLCSLCESHGVTLLFSVTMLNHTHEILMVPDWASLVEVYRVLDLMVTRTIRRRSPKRYRKGIRILKRHPTYVVIRDIVSLFCTGKYLYDNPEYFRALGKKAPHSCFWMFELNHFTTPYDETIYTKLFGLSPREIFDIYSQKSPEDVWKYARQHFSFWTPEMNRAVFYRK